MANRLAVFAATVCMVLAAAPCVSATDIYNTDPAITKNMRNVDALLAPSGGSIELPASDGVSARLSYPANDACPGSKIHISALGPAGVERASFDTVFFHGWKPFYVLTITFDAGNCARDRVAFHGFPQLEVRNPLAKKRAIYYMDFVIESGNDTHIPVGPPDEQDTRDIRFSFASLPLWARSASGASMPTGPIYRMIIGRQ